MRKIFWLGALGIIVLIMWFTLGMSSAQAQRPLPPNDVARGLIYDGLEVATEGKCRGGFKVRLPGGREQCTHGPDAAPARFNVAQSVAPLRAPNAPASTVVCDGDGVSGNRVQVIYAHAADVPSRYATYLTSFQQWAAEVDAEFHNSAAQTGGDRRVRFVTDATCKPVILEVQLSTTGDDNFSNTLNDLWTQGFNRTDRKYMVFVDARRYCGIGTIEYDDRAEPTNRNNTGPHYGRIDAGCWSGVIAAHELMHNLGGVQMSAPHSDGNWHCSDGYDNMCDHGGKPIQIVCPDPSGDSLFDCNHDDYFHTNPPAGSYLATHWNTANNQFLFEPKSARVESFVIGKIIGGVFTPTSTFGQGETVVLKTHVVDQNDAPLSGATVNYIVNQPSGTTQCALSSTSDSNGNAQGTCALPADAPTGTWSARIGGLTYPAGVLRTPSSLQITFVVQNRTPTAVTLSSFTARANATASFDFWLPIVALGVCGGLALTLRAH
jgi:hypothetical protein